MNRTILITTAAIAAAFVQPLPAKDHGGGSSGGDHSFGGGGARAGDGASAHVQQTPGIASHFPQMPRTEARVQMPRAATQSQALAVQESARSMRSQLQGNPRAVITNRSIERQNRPIPTIAFGGSAPRNAESDAQSTRRFENATTDTRTFSRSDFRHSRPPGEAFRNWDRRQMHTWNHHRYRWFNNDWVIFDGVYGDPYYYDAAPYSDYDAAPYDNSTAALPFEYSATDSLASAVQEELARKGYNPGAVDGVIGPQTRNAIAQFQNDHRLPVTGRIDRALLSAMNL